VYKIVFFCSNLVEMPLERRSERNRSAPKVYEGSVIKSRRPAKRKQAPKQPAKQKHQHKSPTDADHVVEAAVQLVVLRRFVSGRKAASAPALHSQGQCSGILDGRVGYWAVHPAVLLHDPVSPVATAAASRDRPGLQQHDTVQRVLLSPRDTPAPDVLLESVASYAKMTDGAVSTLAAAVSSVLVEAWMGRPRGDGPKVAECVRGRC
jgi:hypothetical protein